MTIRDAITPRWAREAGRPRSPMVAALVGHVVEWYEFSIFGVLAGYISLAIFPDADVMSSLMLTWAAFAGAFLVRPLGGVILARLADRAGRRRALYTSVTLMTAATAGIAFVPNTALAGAAAPILFIGLRLAQGFAVGGEMGSAVPYVTESVERAHRSRAVSALAAGTFAAALVGALVAATLASVLPAAQMQEWGWRIPFLLALPLGLAAIVIRRGAPESPAFERLASAHGQVVSPIRVAARRHWRPILALTGISLAFSVILSATLTGYLSEVLIQGYDPTEALVVSIAGYSSLVVAILVLAPLSDAIGRRRTLLIGTAAAAALVLPQLAMARSGSLLLVSAGAMLLAIPAGILATPVYLALSEFFPVAVRATGAGLAFNTATALASLVPFVALGLRRSGFDDGLALCVFAAVGICGGVVLFGWKAVQDRVE